MLVAAVHSRLIRVEDIGQLVELRKILINSGDSYYAAKNQAEDYAWQASYRLWLHDYIISSPRNINVIIFCFIAPP